MEIGDLPLDATAGGRMEQDRWDTTWALAKAGSIEEIDPDLRIRHYGTFKRIAMDYMARAPNLEGVCGLWIWGESGCGKTRAVLSRYPDCFIKPRNQWWDGYQGEKIVLVDDVDIFDKALGGKFKHWADFAPFIAEIKGGSMRIRPERLIITSQYPMDRIWDDRETLDALGRRFTVIEKIKDQNIIL